MTFKEYNEFVKSLKVYPEPHAVIYPALGLSGEVGEYCGKISKWLRGDYEELDVKALKKELGDILFFVVASADDLGLTFDEIAEGNVEKLSARKKQGNIKGNGDNREEDLKQIFDKFNQEA